MTTTTFKLKKLVAMSSAAVFMALGAPYMMGDMDSGFISAAQAAESHTDGGGAGKGGKQGAGGQKKGAGGHEAATGGASKTTEAVLSEEEEGGKGSMQQGGGSHDHGQADANKQKGSGQGAPGEDSDAKGPKYSGGQGDATHGGKPVWAQEGIPEVELGRLNVARAPSKVLDRSLAEALVALAANPALYQLPTLEAVITAISTGKLPDGTAIVRIDSPLENLALYKDILQDGKIVLPDGTTFVTALSTADLAAIFLGGASDKTVAIVTDTVVAMDTILNVTLPAGTTEATLAAAADDVREAIQVAHDK